MWLVVTNNNKDKLLWIDNINNKEEMPWVDKYSLLMSWIEYSNTSGKH